jgi:hypothetical protein
MSFKCVSDIEYHKSTGTQAKLTPTPQDQSWAYYFRISEDISTKEYRIAYHKDNSKPGVRKLGSEHFVVIEVEGELFYVDTYSLFRIWAIEGILLGDTFIEKIDNIFNNSMATEHCYHWDSIIERIKILNKYDEYVFIDVDKILRRETKIDQILKK